MAISDEIKTIFGTADHKRDLDLMIPENKLTQAWGAEAQDQTPIPWESEDPDQITLKKLVPRKYAMDPIASGKFIELGEFNGLLIALSKYIPDIFGYTGGIPYDEKWATDHNGYPIDVMVSILYNPYNGKLWVPDKEGNNATENTPEGMEPGLARAMQRRLLVRSLKSNNTDSPLIRENLFKSWEIVDGRCFGEIIKLGLLSEYAPPGYIDMASEPNQTYLLKDYPRVALYLEYTQNPCSHFKKLNDNEFTITNTSGLFERVYNTYTGERVKNPDPGRAFDEIQDDAMGVITGAVNLVDYSYYSDDSSYGDVANRCLSLRAFSPVAKLPRAVENKKEYAHLKTVESNNAFKIMDMPTNYAMSSSDDSYRYRGIYGSGISKDGIKSATGSTLVLDTSDHPKSGHEIRPKNYCVKMYIKV